uniref:DUF5977 domain-containing protein n=1 Tax=Flavobacterium sp. TaxID=239 RepID=UPI00374D12BD
NAWYTVPAGRYSSTVSQAHADSQAQTDINNNGQAFANDDANARCIFKNAAKSVLFTRNFADFKRGGPFIDTAEDFDKKMSSVSPAYKKQIEGFGAFEINLFLCESGSGNNSMAKKISKAHPLAKVVGFDGFVKYGSRNGTPLITGVESLKGKGEGYRVVFQNGKEISRMLYSEYLKLDKNINK